MIGDQARVYGGARVLGTSSVYGRARVFEAAYISDSVVRDDAMIYGTAELTKSSTASGFVWIFAGALVRASEVTGSAWIDDSDVETCFVAGNAWLGPHIDCKDSRICETIPRGEATTRSRIEGAVVGCPPIQ